MREACLIATGWSKGHPQPLLPPCFLRLRGSFVLTPMIAFGERLLWMIDMLSIFLRRVLKLLPQVEDTTSDEDEGHE